jgi:RHS repeat-associated protein
MQRLRRVESTTLASLRMMRSRIVVYNPRFPGQYYDAETGLNYNYFRDYDSATGRYVESDPTGLWAGVNTYTYVLGNPIWSADPVGLDVQMCRQPAFGIANNPLDHYWLKTDSVEAGMGGTRGNIPGAQSGDRPWDPVQVTNHAGRSKQPGASCTTVHNVDEKKVNDQLKIGRPLGKWTPANQCYTFATQVLQNAATGSPPPLVPGVPLYLIK